MGFVFELGSIFTLSIVLAWFVQAVRLPFILRYFIMPPFLGGSHAARLLEKYGLSGRAFHLEKERHLKHLENHFM